VRKPSIIVEGADASGKSTLVGKLSVHYGIHAFSAGPPPVDMAHAEICMLYQTHWLLKYPCVWDRFTGISNVCNLPEIQEDADLKMHASYVNQILSSPVIIVICTAQNLDGHARAVYESEEDEARMRSENKIVRNNYVRMAHDLPGVISYDFKVMSFRQLVGRIDHAFSKRLQRPSH